MFTNTEKDNYNCLSQNNKTNKKAIRGVGLRI